MLWNIFKLQPGVALCQSYWSLFFVVFVTLSSWEIGQNLERTAMFVSPASPAVFTEWYDPKFSHVIGQSKLPIKTSCCCVQGEATESESWAAKDKETNTFDHDLWMVIQSNGCEFDSKLLPPPLNVLLSLKRRYYVFSRLIMSFYSTIK